MLIVKKTVGAILTFLSTFLVVVGVGRAQSSAAVTLLGLAVVFGGLGLWLLLSKPKSQATAR
ncbi:MAG UNVERIFIED_CONTAM: hypothetical protein LVR18_11265 [Planctomycetaceae bacterium]